MDFQQRLHNHNFILRLGKSIRERLHDITVEPLPWDFIRALSKLRSR
jgi:hypothetical protein